MIEYEITNLFLADAQLIEETPILMIEYPFNDNGLNKLLELTKNELKAGRRPKVAGLYAKKEFERLTGLKTTLSAIENHRGQLNKLNSYEVTIKEAWEERQLKVMAQEILINSDCGFSTDSHVGQINKTLDRIESTTATDEEISLSDATNNLIERWIQLGEGDTSLMIPTGISNLDNMILGFQRGTHVLICARPSVGKTAMGLTCMSNQDLAGIATGFVSVEMSEAQCIERIGQIRSEVSHRDILKGQGTQEEFAQLVKEVQAIPEDNTMQIRHTVNRKLANIKRIIRKMKKNKPDLAVVYIDYIQRIDYGDKAISSNPVTNVEEVSKSITDLSQELNICIVSLAQLNRGGGDAPKMSHLKGSGQLEQDGHLIIILDRDLKSQLDDNMAQDTTGHLDCGYIVCKNRDGETGYVKGGYLSKFTKFTDGLRW